LSLIFGITKNRIHFFTKGHPKCQEKNLPGYLLHKRSGQAVVVIQGKTIYLGKYKSKASREEYERVIGEYIANGKKLPPTRVNGLGISIEELIIKFLDYAESYYQENGKVTATLSHCKLALSPVSKYYDTKPVSDFGPLSLVFIRDKWVEAGIARKTINRWVSIVRQAVRWGVAHELVASEILHALEAVDNLKEGRTLAPEYREVQPVSDEIIEKTLPHLLATIADMVRIQRFGGMRSQDVRNMRFCDVDRTGDIWKYTPFEHKTEHHGKERVLPIGPRAQAILLPYLIDKQDTSESFLFSPADSEKARKLEMRKRRKSPVQPSQRRRDDEDRIRK